MSSVEVIKGRTIQLWASALADEIKTKDQFKEKFVPQYWGTNVLMKARLLIYEDKFTKGNNISLSEHLLRHAIREKFLDPTIPENEFLYVIRSHYPIEIQKSWITNQPKTIVEAISFLQQIESLDQQSPSKDYDSRLPQHEQRHHDQHRGRNWRGNSPQSGAVHLVQYQHGRDRQSYQPPFYRHQNYIQSHRQNYHQNQRHNYYQNHRNQDGGTNDQRSQNNRPQLNPHSPPYNPNDTSRNDENPNQQNAALRPKRRVLAELIP
jgi:hypothetical protein